MPTEPGVMDSALVSAVVAAVVSAVISGVIGFFCSWYVQRRNEWTTISDRIDEMSRLTIEYPYLENSAYCSQWSLEGSEEKRDRYSAYCCIVFNTLERLWKHYSDKKKKIEKHVGVREIVHTHRAWWKSRLNEEDNAGGYRAAFRRFVDSYLGEG